ncbi:MAG: PIN domain-containing protein [Thermoleophilia bacterium]
MGKESLKLARVLGAHSLVAIDTPVFIYHFEAHPRYKALTTQIFKSVETGDCKAVTSTLARLELLVRPLKEQRADIADSYRFMLDTFPNLLQVDIDKRVADSAADFRAGTGLSTPDSLHIACAMVAGATLFITNDSDFKMEFDELQIILLDELI